MAAKEWQDAAVSPPSEPVPPSVTAGGVVVPATPHSGAMGGDDAAAWFRECLALLTVPETRQDAQIALAGYSVFLSPVCQLEGTVRVGVGLFRLAGGVLSTLHPNAAGTVEVSPWLVEALAECRGESTPKATGRMQCSAMDLLLALVHDLRKQSETLTRNWKASLSMLDVTWAATLGAHDVASLSLDDDLPVADMVDAAAELFLLLAYRLADVVGCGPAEVVMATGRDPLDRVDVSSLVQLPTVDVEQELLP